jgi:hypothetical protein
MNRFFAHLLFAGATVLNAQQATISGFIDDAASAERLPAANVYVADQPIGTASNTYGFYSLTLPRGSYKISAALVGFEKQTVTIDLRKDTVIDWHLFLETELLQEAVVTAEASEVERTQMSQVDIPVAQIKKIPALFGEVDVLKVIQLLPGVQSGNEGSSGIYVRGGGPDQNLILMDGVTVYNASHLFGFFSVFNADAIKNVSLTKGGFPARHGGRLSSVLEIDLKEGSMKKFSGVGALGLISSKLFVEGPIIKDKMSFAVSGRRTYIDALVNAVQPPEEGSAGYYFGDLTAKLNYNLSDRDRVYASFYTGKDKFYSRFDEPGGPGSGNETNESDLKWGNTTFALRWNHVHNPKLFANTALTYSDYKFEVGSSASSGNEQFSAVYITKIEDLAAKVDFDYLPNVRHRMKFGGSLTQHIFTPGALSYKESGPGVNIDSVLQFSPKTRSYDFFIYGEDEYRVNSRIKVNLGMHYAGYAVEGDYLNSLQPRVSGRYLIDDQLSAKFSYASMMQFIHLLSNTSVGLPTDLWVPATAQVPAQSSQQIAAGLTHSIPNLKLDLSIEGYYKWMDGLIEYKEGASFISRSNWQSQIETNGRGWAYGMEFLVQRKLGQLSGWVGYTLAWSKRQFAELNKGEIYPYKFDRRHDLSVVLVYDISERLDIGATWVYGSGNTITMPVEYYRGPQTTSFFDSYYGGLVEHYSDRNAYRMPAYHRLDVSLNFKKKTKWGSRVFNISVYNLYNHQNPFFLYVRENGNNEREVRQVSLFPILPSIGYIFKF